MRGVRLKMLDLQIACDIIDPMLSGLLPAE